MGSLYSEQHTWLHAVPAYVKLIALTLLGTGLFFTDHWLTLLMASACCLCVFLSLGKAATKTKPFLMGLAIACALIAAFHWYQQRLDLATITVLRLVSTSLMGVALTLTTRYSDLSVSYTHLTLPTICSV